MGVLRVKVSGNWVDVGGSADVVWVNPDAPTDPNIEMWYDTDAFGLGLGGGPVQGVVYGVNMYNGVLGANTAIPQTTAIAMITIAMPAAPAGTLLDLGITAYINSSVGHGSAFLSWRVNGVTAGPTIVVTDETALRTYSGRVVNVAAPTGIAYNIDLMAAKSNAGGSAIMQGTNSYLSVVSYRP